MKRRVGVSALAAALSALLLACGSNNDPPGPRLPECHELDPAGCELRLDCVVWDAALVLAKYLELRPPAGREVRDARGKLPRGKTGKKTIEKNC